MIVEFQPSKEEYLRFLKSYLKETIFRKRLPYFIFFVFVLIFVIGGDSKTWPRPVMGLIISPFIAYSLLYYVPYFINLMRLNKVLVMDKSVLEKKNITITDEGLLTESESKTTIRKWDSIISAQSNTLFIYITLADKKLLYLPKNIFESESDAINFLGSIQTKIIRLRGGSYFPANRITRKPNYLWGLLCLIPILGGIVGVILVVDGISKYKDKWIIIFGAGGMIISAGFLYALNYSDSFGFKPMMANQSQMQLNSLMKAVEFYKIKNGIYPDNLDQVNNDNSYTFIIDPLQSGGPENKGIKYNYQKVGDHYYLFSSGIDGLPGTKDDIYPQVLPADSAKFGLIHK